MLVETRDSNGIEIMVLRVTDYCGKEGMVMGWKGKYLDERNSGRNKGRDCSGGKVWNDKKKG